MRNPYEMSVNVVKPDNKIVEKKVKEQVDLKVTIPGGMPMSLFPLKFYVSSEKNSIYAKPGGDMYSESYTGGYGFVKEISWEFYRDANSTGTNANGEPVGIKEADGRISFTCNLVTNCIVSATDVYVDNEYFKRGSDRFDNSDISEIVIPKTQKVSVQQDNNRYPERIYNKGNNEGTINDVKVFLNGVDTGKTITINSNKVVLGTTMPAGVKLSDKMRFTFSDKYWTRSVWSSDWSRDPATYSYECTVEEFLYGVILDFKR
jgi:hypothetical protein